MRPSTLTIILAFILGTAFLLPAQNPNVVLGPIIKAPSRTYISGVLTKTEDGYLVKRDRRTFRSSSPIIEKYDNNFNIVSAKEMLWEENDKDVMVYDLLQTSEHIYAIGGVRNKQTKEYHTYFRSIDPEKIAYNDDKTEIGSMEFQSVGSRVYWYGVGMQNDPLMLSSYDLSDDSTKILCFGGVPVGKDEPEKFRFSVFHEQGLVKLFETEVTLPYENKLFQVEKILLSNDASVYVMGILYNEKAKKKVKGEPNYKYVVLAYPPGSDEPQEYIIELADRFITDITMKIADNGDLVCAGFISDKGTTSIKGITFFTIDGISGDIKSKSVKEFGADFMGQFMSSKKSKKGGKELYAYYIDDIITREDGGAILLAEQYYVRVVTYRDRNGTHTDYHYYFNHIIAANISPEGTIDWCIKVPKLQHTVNDGGYYSSYALGVKDNKIYLMFNDNVKNLSLGPGDAYSYFNGRKSLAVVVTIDSEGNQKREALFSNKEAGTMLRPKACSQIGEDEILIYGEIRRNYLFGKFILGGE